MSFPHAWSLRLQRKIRILGIWEIKIQSLPNQKWFSLGETCLGLCTQHEGVGTHLEGLLFFFGSWERGHASNSSWRGEVTGRGGRQREIGSRKAEGDGMIPGQHEPGWVRRPGRALLTRVVCAPAISTHCSKVTVWLAGPGRGGGVTQGQGDVPRCKDFEESTLNWLDVSSGRKLLK